MKPSAKREGISRVASCCVAADTALIRATSSGVKNAPPPAARGEGGCSQALLTPPAAAEFRRQGLRCVGIVIAAVQHEDRQNGRRVA